MAITVHRSGEDVGPFGEGDAARLTAAGTRAVTAGPDGAEVVLWEAAAHRG